MRRNIRLYFKGMFAKGLQAIGLFLIFFGFYGWLWFSIWMLLISVCGIGLFIYGKALRFEYQRQSGTIIHGGDGWR